MINELKKIEEILDWHPEFDIKKLIRNARIRRNIVYILLILLLSLSVVFNYVLYNKNHIIKELNVNLNTLENTLWSNNDVKDSLMNTIESSGYLKYLIESESKISLSHNVNKDHIKYMFERAIDKKIPVSILFRLIYKESRFDSVAISSAGAFGYMQLLPSTYALYCSKMKIEVNPVNARKNIFIGTQFLADLYDYWHKKKPKEKPEVIWDYVLATYNIGIANINDTTFLRKDVNNYINFINN
jgi:soluble lytic murein transglycosylase-like protein